LLDWSYDLLKRTGRSACWGVLSVFAGGLEPGSGREVCAVEGIEEWDVLDLLMSLVDKSLVVYDQREGREGIVC